MAAGRDIAGGPEGYPNNTIVVALATPGDSQVLPYLVGEECNTNRG